MEITNYMEQVVGRVLAEIAGKYPQFCNCDRCQNDVMALALNNLKPHYTSTEHGQVYVKCLLLDQNEHAKIVAEVTKALMQVMQRPHRSEGC